MTREWVDDRKANPFDKRWVMRCDTIHASGQRCTTEGNPSMVQPDLELYVRLGWHIGQVYGDMCPLCLAAGYVPSSSPHKLMNLTVEEVQQ